MHHSSRSTLIVNGTTLEAAEYYAAQGWHVVPVWGKRPIPKHGLHAATTEIDQYRELFREPNGVAIRTGLISKLLVVDIDSEAGQRTWDAEFATKFPEPLLVVETHKGSHLYFTCHHEVTTKIRWRPDIDVLGENQIVVAPPSPHPHRGAYRLVRAASSSPLEAGHAQLLRAQILVAYRPQGGRAARHKPAPTSPAVRSDPGLEEFARSVCDRQVKHVRRAVEGERNAALNRAAFAMARVWHLLCSRERRSYEDALRSAASETGLPLTEISSTLKSAVRAGEEDRVDDPVRLHVERQCLNLWLAAWEALHPQWPKLKVVLAMTDVMRRHNSVQRLAIGVRDLADAARVTTNTVTNTIRRLTRLGLVACEAPDTRSRADMLSAMAWAPEHPDHGARYLYANYTPELASHDVWGHGDANATGLMIWLTCARGVTTRRQIVETTGMSAATVSRVTRTLVGLGLLVQREHGFSHGPSSPNHARSWPTSRKARDRARYTRERVRFARERQQFMDDRTPHCREFRPDPQQLKRIRRRIS